MGTLEERQAAGFVQDLPELVGPLLVPCPAKPQGGWRNFRPVPQEWPQGWTGLTGSDMDATRASIGAACPPAVRALLRAYQRDHTKDFGILWRAFGKEKADGSGASAKARLFYGGAPGVPASAAAARRMLRQVVPGARNRTLAELAGPYEKCHDAAPALARLLTDVAAHYSAASFDGWPQLRFAGLPPPSWGLRDPPPENLYYVIFIRHPGRHGAAGKKGLMGPDMTDASITWACVHAIDYMDKANSGQTKKNSSASHDPWALHYTTSRGRGQWSATNMQIHKKEDPHLLQFTGYRGTGRDRKPPHAAILPLSYRAFTGPNEQETPLYDGNFRDAGDRAASIAAFDKAMDKLFDALTAAGTTAWFAPLYADAPERSRTLVVHPWHSVLGNADCFA